jgi:hypothetical protein
MIRGLGARAEESLVTDRVARPEIRDRLELGVEVAVAQQVRQPEGADLGSRNRKRSQVAERIPLRRARIVGSYADPVRERPQRLVQACEEHVEVAFEEETPRPTINLRADPPPTERQGHRSLDFLTLGSDEEGPCVPPAIKPAEDPAVQSAFGLLQRDPILAGRARVCGLFSRRARPRITTGARIWRH